MPGFSGLSSEGGTSSQCCSDDVTTKCRGKLSNSQLWICDTRDNRSWESCVYHNAPRNPIDVASHKPIVGVGSKGVIRGKGLSLRRGASNVIIQNIHITVSLQLWSFSGLSLDTRRGSSFMDFATDEFLQELNPQFVWGGDAITLGGTDKAWIDHCKLSLVVRQMIVSGWGAAGHVAISNNEFDGRTSWSAGCNDKRT